MMKSSFKKLRDFTFNKNGVKDKRSALVDQQRQQDDQIAARMEVLTDMREQYDGLLAAAQNVSGASYDFSRSIHEMASYMLETFGKFVDGDTGSNFSMLGKVQYEISKHLDAYAAHVSQTIIKPTENLLKELESVEVMKKQYEDKRELYNQMKLQKPKGRRKKGDGLEQQVMTLLEQLNDKATLFDLRFQSLRLGRKHSLITQATRHHMAQAHLFDRGLNSLNAVGSMVTQLSRDLHIDHTLSDGDIGSLWNADKYETEAEVIGNDDEEESMLSSPGSSQPIRTEVEEHIVSQRPGGTPKPWEISSKSAPLHPSAYAATRNAVVVPDIEEAMPPEKEVTTYALPIPTGPSARLYNHATTSGTKADVPHSSRERPEFRRTRTGSAGSFIETHGLIGFSRLEAPKPSGSPHAMGAGEEEAPSWKEKRSSYHATRSPNHSHSTSFSEGLDPLSVSSDGHLISMASFSYKQSTRENDAHVGITHGVDPLYRSGPIGRSAPWGLTPLKVSPCASPPVSHVSPPLISELHKLPAPPTTPPQSEPAINYSAPLGTKALATSARKSAVAAKPIESSSSALVKKSRSIPSSANFVGNLHHTKLIKVDDSPVIESP